MPRVRTQESGSVREPSPSKIAAICEPGESVVGVDFFPDGLTDKSTSTPH